MSDLHRVGRVAARLPHCAQAQPELADLLLRQAVGLRDLASQTTAKGAKKIEKASLPAFKQYREADGQHYFKLVEPGGRVLLQSQGFASPREAGQAVAALRAQGPAGLAALAEQIQRPHEVSENELGNALSLLMQAD